MSKSLSNKLTKLSDKMTLCDYVKLLDQYQYILQLFPYFNSNHKHPPPPPTPPPPNQKPPHNQQQKYHFFYKTFKFFKPKFLKYLQHCDMFMRNNFAPPPIPSLFHLMTSQTEGKYFTNVVEDTFLTITSAISQE